VPLSFVLVAVLLLAGCAPRTPPAAPVSGVKQGGPELATFEFAWRFVKEAVPAGQVDEASWQAVYDRLLPRAAQARTPSDLRPVLSDMLASLGQSHYTVISGTVNEVLEVVLEDSPVPLGAGGGDPGLDVRLLDHAAVVTHVFPGGAAASAGVHLGDRVVTIAGRDVASWIAMLEGGVEDRWLVEAYSRIVVVQALMASSGTAVPLGVERDGAGLLALSLVPAPSTLVAGPGLGGAQPLHVESSVLAPGVGYVHFDHFLMPVPEQFTAAVTRFRTQGVSSLVLDLRGNPGGLVAMVRGMGGHLIAERTSLGTMVTQAAPLALTVNPSPEILDGPVAVLIDSLSASTSEVFASGLQAVGRARVFGTRSAGRALPSMIIALPNGDLLQAATGRFEDPKGRAIEGTGVVPDEEIPLDRGALSAGRDPVLEAALGWIQSAQETK
jgi:carboxyl-terminal processing protease